MYKHVKNLPKVIRIEPASLCNLKCSHCPTGTVSMKRTTMDWTIFESLLNSLFPYANSIQVFVLYHGGEPLLNKVFSKMVSDLKNKFPRAKIKTVSNGMLLNENNSKQIIESGLDEIEFSIDGESPEDNNKIRRNADFEKVSYNIKEFLKLKSSMGLLSPKVYISTTQFIDVLKLNGHGTRNAHPPKYLLDTFSKELSDGHIIGLKSTYAMEWPHMVVDPELYQSVIDSEEQNIKNYCDHVENTLTVRANGDVVPCCYDLTSQKKMGNINEQSLNDIWNGAKYQTLRTEISNGKPSGICANCNVVMKSKYLVKRF